MRKVFPQKQDKRKNSNLHNLIKIQKYDKIEILKRSEIALLDDLDKKELIQKIQKLEKENNELKEKLYGKIQ